MNQPKSPSLFDAGLIVAAFTGFIYLLAVFCNLGIAAFYGIPHYLIEINLSTMVLLLAKQLFYVLNFILSVSLVYTRHNKFYRINYLLLSTIVIYFSLSTLLLDGIIHLFKLKLFLNDMVVLAFALIIIMLIFPMRENHWIMDRDKKQKPTSSMGELVIITSVMLFLLHFSITSYIKGSESAQNVENYFVVSNHPSIIIVGKSAEKFIGITIDRKTLKKTDTLVLVSSENCKLKLSKFQINNPESWPGLSLLNN